MIQSEEGAEELLGFLDQALEIEGAEPMELLVCGGAALLVTGLASRATEDVDVLAIIENEEDVRAKPFPVELTRAIKRVARDRGLPEDWMNPGPADIQSVGATS